MGRSYDQLTLDDRCEIARLFANGNSVRQIAAALDRSPSTVSRELKRNRGATETGAASEEVLNSAKTLSSESARLREELDRFMANIRAA